MRDTSDTTSLVLLRCPRCYALYEHSLAGVVPDRRVTLEEAASLYPSWQPWVVTEEIQLQAQVVQRELWIQGTAVGFGELGKLIADGWRGSKKLHPLSEASGTALDTVEVLEDQHAHVVLSPEEATLLVSGSTPALDRLARNLVALGTVVQPGSHAHWDPFPGHPIVDRDSWPVVLARVPEPHALEGPSAEVHISPVDGRICTAES